MGASFLGRPRKFLKVVIVIAKIVSLRKDGDQTPQFYELAVKYDGVGAPNETVVYGTEENVRELLRDGGIAGVEIDALFNAVLKEG
jgi:hypothetical protein